MSSSDAVPLARGEGAWFARSDCAGMLRRLLILLVDALVVLGIVGLAVVISHNGFESSLRQTTLVAWWSLLVASFIYLAVLKPTSLRTLGYRLFDVRIVTLRGERPSVLRMTCRLLLWVFGPFHMVVDWLWLGGDPSRQTLRDKVAGTLVVRTRATPVGRGRIGVAFYDLLALNIPFLEVKRQEDTPAPHASLPPSGAVSATATPGTRQHGTDWPQILVGITYVLFAAGGVVWTVSGAWEMLFDDSPRSVVVNNGDEVLYADTASEAQARKLAEILTDLGYFGGSNPGYAYLEVSHEATEVSFFVPEEAWNQTQLVDYYESLGGAIADRNFASPVVIKLRTPDWEETRILLSD